MMEQENTGHDVSILGIQVVSHESGFVAATELGQVILVRHDPEAARQDGQTVLNWIYTLNVTQALAAEAAKVPQTVQ